MQSKRGVNWATWCKIEFQQVTNVKTKSIIKANNNNNRGFKQVSIKVTTVSTSTMEALAVLVFETTYEEREFVQGRNTRFASCVQVWPDLHKVVIYVSWQFQSG